MANAAYKFKIDENLPIELRDAFNAAGHDAMTVGDQSLSGLYDEPLDGVCEAEARTIVTFDLGFSDIRYFPASSCRGRIVLRIRRQDTPAVLAVASGVIRLLQSEPLIGCLWIVDETGVRIRGGDRQPPGAG